ncbi:MAG: MCE family protein [Bacteroidetes bacterium]|nr:MCE family protein [Bacteroidota bacterium]
MKISNELKVGLIAVISITVLILGFNFLKGKTFFSHSTTLFAVYGNVQKLSPSNPVIINGLQVGSVYKISTDKDMRRLLVNMTITKDIHIPKNSIAIIKPDLLSTPSIEIKLGDSNEYLNSNDTLATESSSGIFTDVLKRVDPVLYEVTKAVSSIDSILIKVNGIVDPNAKNNIGATLANLNKISAELLTSSASLNQLLNTQTGALAKTLNNASAVTGNLAASNDKITSVLSNLDKTTSNLSQLDLQKTLASLDATINELKNAMSKLDSTGGTAGLLLNDPTLYKNLASTANKLNLLIDDIRVNPKRYVSISVFGKKNKTQPLTTPLVDTINAPYIIEKAPNH